MNHPFMLNISVSSQEEACVALQGELDIYTRPKLEALLNDLLEQGCSRITLDMSKLKYIDSCGLIVLVKYNQMCLEAGGSFALIDPAPQVRKILRITALDNFFEILETISASPRTAFALAERGEVHA